MSIPLRNKWGEKKERNEATFLVRIKLTYRKRVWYDSKPQNLCLTRTLKIYSKPLLLEMRMLRSENSPIALVRATVDTLKFSSLSISLISTIELASVKRKACISHGSSSFPASHYLFSGNIQVPCFSFGALLILISFPELWKIDVWYCKTTSQVTLLWILGFVGEGSW